MIQKKRELSAPSPDGMKSSLAASWWIVFPAFGVLELRTTYERGWMDLTEVWPWLAGRPLLALLVGAIFVAAHWWCLGWYFVAVRTTRRLAPSAGQLLGMARPPLFQVASLATLLVMEYSPVSIWRWIARLSS